MIRINSLVILCLAQWALAEDRISVDTVGTITATAGYSISDSNNHSPTMASLTSNTDFTRDPSKDGSSSSSSESYNPVTSVQGLRGGQSLTLRSRQARGKPTSLQQQQQQWLQPHGSSAEDSGIATFPYTVATEHHRVNEQLYSVKPQTFDSPQSSSSQSSLSQSPLSQSSSSSVADGKSDETSAENSAPITYGKKMQKSDEHDDRPVYAAAAATSDWSEDVHVKFDGGADKTVRPRKKNGGPDKSRRAQGKKSTAGSSSMADSKEGWQEVSPNMEIATGYSATVQDHGSSQESSDSAESYLKSSMGLFQSSSTESGISSIENAAQVEPQNFNHKQVLSKMNHFDFSNAVSLANKTPPPREKRLNYQPGGSSSPVRFAFGGGGGQPLQAMVPSSALPPAAAVKSVKIEQPVPNYHSIVVPMPVSHQMYAAISGGGGGDAMSSPLGHQMTSSTMQQAMMSLPVVHNVFFKTDENGGGKTMPAIVIPLKPEYLQHLQQQQYSYMQQQQHSSDPPADSQNAAGHQRPVHHTGGAKTLQYQQQQQTTSSLTPSPYLQQKPKPNRVKKPFGLTKDDQQQHRVKQPFGLQHQFYSNPFVGGGGAVGAGHHLGHQSAHGVTNQHQVQHGHHAQQHEMVDDTRHAQTASVAAQAAQPFPGPAGHPMMVKRPQAYGYASPVAMPPAKFVQQVVNKAHQYQLQQQQQQVSAEDMAALVVQQQLQQPYKATTFHPGFTYLTSPDDDYPYRPIYKDAKKRNDMLVAQTN